MKPLRRKTVLKYLLEFFMLFLAVFLGFVAENIREENEERERERDYIISMKSDLQTDIAKLNYNIAGFSNILLMHDTLVSRFPNLEQGFDPVFYRNINSIKGYPDFFYTDATIQQLKNSGGFLLIKKPGVIEQIMEYDAVVKRALLNEGVLKDRLIQLADLQSNAFNQFTLFQELRQGKSPEQLEAEKFDLLFTHDKTLLHQFHSQLQYYQWLTKVVKEDMTKVKTSATKLIEFLEEEYKISGT